MIIALFLFFSCKLQDNKNGNYQLHNKKFQPQIHYSPAENWMGKPCAFFHFRGKYHVFYEYNPSANVWGNIHWGHAVSNDLIHWQELPASLVPDKEKPILSGSVVVDMENSSGLGTKGNPPFIAYFTQSGMNNVPIIAMTISMDEGKSWKKYTGDHGELNKMSKDYCSDPKVFWHKPTQQWIMCLASDNRIKFFTSPDCIHWLYRSEFRSIKDWDTGYWENPELVELKHPNSDESKWILLVTNRVGPVGQAFGTEYIVGDFNGITFIPVQEATDLYSFWIDYGSDCSESVVCANAPENRKIMLSWMNSWAYSGSEPSGKWSGSLTFPRELSLIQNDELYLLSTIPVRELGKLHLNQKKIENCKIGVKPTQLFQHLLAGYPAAEIRLKFDISGQDAISFPETYGITFRNSSNENYTINYNNIRKSFEIDRSNAADKMHTTAFAFKYNIYYKPQKQTFDWLIIVDRHSIEFFADGCRIAVTNTVYPSDPFDTLELFTDISSLNLKEAHFIGLKSIWN